METLVKRIDEKKAIISLFIGIFCAMGATLKLGKMATEANSEYLEFANPALVFVRTFAISFSAARLNTVLLAVVVALLVYVTYDLAICRRDKIVLVICSLGFGLSQLLAYAYKKTADWYILYEFPVNRVKTIIKLLAYSIIFYHIFKLLLAYIRERFVQKDAPTSAFAAKSVLLCILLMLFAWLPYFFIFYPGTSNEDTVIQLMEVFEIPSYIQKITALPSDDIFITNHHPYAVTMLFYAFFKLGLNLFGDINKGVAAYILLHMLFLATSFSLAVQYLRYVGVSRKRTAFVQIVLMFYPMFPLYSVCMVKDTLYAAFCLNMIILLHHVMMTKGEALKKWWINLLIFIDALCVMVTKNYGVYVLLIVAIIYAVVFRKQILRIAISLLIPIILYHFIYINMLLPALNVAPGGRQEALSVPIQQTARYVQRHGDEVTKSEKKAINAILPYNKLAKRYNPELCDPVKEKFKQDATDAELKTYFKYWFKMFKKHPGCYVQATLNNTYQYWDVNKVSNLQYYEWNTYLQRHDPGMEHEELYVTNLYNMGGERYGIQQLVILVQKVPILNIFSSLGLFPWIILFMFLQNWFAGFTRRNMALIVPIITYAVCFVSPDNGNSRYIMPVVFSFPFLLMLNLLPYQDAD